MNKPEKFALLLRDTFFTWRSELDRRFKPFGLSQAKWRVLLSLYMCDVSLTQTSLAQKLGIEKPTLVGLLDRLNKDGWIVRHEDSQDRRVKTVHLTQKAIEMSKKMHDVAEALRLEIMKDIDKDELAICISVLESINKKLKTD